MVAKVAIIFAGIIVAGAFLNLYYFAITILTVTILGIENQLFLAIQYWVCLAAGAVTAFWLMRKVWPKSTGKAEVAQNEPAE